MSILLKLEPITNIYDTLHSAWEHPRMQRGAALGIFFFYIGVMLAIEANRMGILPPWLVYMTPHNHFYAVSLAFTLILGLEIMSLILIIACSLARALNKQLEIMALIFLRDAFKELSSLPEPVNLADNAQPLIHIAVAGSTALAIFICLGIYGRIRQKHDYLTRPIDRMRYIISKKLVALTLLVAFLYFGLRDSWDFIFYNIERPFFETMYTLLIFSDIALVLIAQRFMPTFHAVFRNSGFVIATLMLRLSLSTAWPWNAAACLFAALYMLALTWATDTFVPEKMKGKKRLGQNIYDPPHLP